MAGYGVGAESAFPARLQAMLRRGGDDVQVANAGIPGDTLRGMLARLDRYVPQETRVVIVQGGYNDVMVGTSGARGTPHDQRAELDASRLGRRKAGLGAVVRSSRFIYCRQSKVSGRWPDQQATGLPECTAAARFRLTLWI
jgi:lysophospholipase L1-like esterase